MEKTETYGGVPPPPGCLYRGTLTKRMLMSVPEGSIIVSNIFTHDRIPAHFRVVPPKGQMENPAHNVINIDGTSSDRGKHEQISSREAVWRSFRKRNLTGRMCWAFKDRVSAKDWLERIGSCLPVTAARE